MNLPAALDLIATRPDLADLAGAVTPTLIEGVLANA